MQTINLDLHSAKEQLESIAENEMFFFTVKYQGYKLVAKGMFDDEGMYRLENAYKMVGDQPMPAVGVDEELAQFIVDVALGNEEWEDGVLSAGEIDGFDFAYGGRIRGGSVYSVA